MTDRISVFAGFGLGLRSDHYADFIDGEVAVDFVEVISENFMLDGGRPLRILEQVRRQYPVVLHGVSMSIGSAHGVDVAYLFIGYIPENKDLYLELQKAGYLLIYKPVAFNTLGEAKGNVDADLVLQVMLDIQKFNKAIIVTSDGDFYSLVKHLYENNKLEKVISPYKQTCSILLKKSAKEKIVYIDNLGFLIGKKKSTA